MRMTVAALTAVAVAAWSCGGDGSAPVATPSPSPSAVGVVATATPSYDGSLHIGAWARVAGPGNCVQFRAGAGAADLVPVNYCQANGFEGYIVAGPFLTDGRWWWAVAGQGWAEDEHLAFVRDENLSTKVVSALRDAPGLLAFIDAGGDLTVMNADGSDRRRLYEGDALGTAPGLALGEPQWRPDGRQIAFTLTQYDDDAPLEEAFRTLIVDLDGNVLDEITDASLASWSPDGTRLAVVTEIKGSGLGSLLGTPVVLDLASGERTPIGPEASYFDRLRWRPMSDELSYSGSDGVVLVKADGTGERLLLDGGATTPANWSPDGNRLTYPVAVESCFGYEMYDIASNAVLLCAAHPPYGQDRGGRDGWSEDGQTDWSPDGSTFAFHTEWADVNASGVYIVNVQTGNQVLLPGWKAAYTSFSPDGQHLAFYTSVDGAQHVWVGDTITGEVYILAEGTAVAWSP